MKKKAILIISFLVFLIFVIGLLMVREGPVNVVFKDKLTVSINDKVTNLSFIEKVDHGEILTKEEVVDTSKLGKKPIQFEVKNKFGKKRTYRYTITVVDLEKPVMKNIKDIEIIEGDSIDLLKGIEVIDNSKETIIPTILGDYDTKKAGEYRITYIAKDSSGNETKEESKLIVKKKEVSSNPTDKTFTTKKGFNGVVKNGLTYIEGILMANKTYPLTFRYGSGLTKETMDAFETMKNAAKKEGLTIYISSGFRSFSRQKTIYQNYVARDGKKAADTYSARPGYSEHQTGLAFDVNTINSSFANTKEAKWLSKNCYKYGFILRYPKGKEKETGYIYEPWHFRFVGKDLAEKVYNGGDWITLEDYFGVTSRYAS